MAKAQHVLVLGIDGTMSHLTRKFAKQGNPPHMARVAKTSGPFSLRSALT